MFERESAKKYALLFSVCFILGLMLLLSVAQPAYADSGQSYASVSLQYFTIQAQYPSTVLPGTTAQIHAQAIAKSSVNLNSLTAYVYYSDGASLHQLTSATLFGNQYVTSGNIVTRDIQLTIPQGIPRTSLFAAFTESIKLSYITSYSSYPHYWYDPNCSSYGYSMQYCYYHTYYNSYPQYSYVTTSDTGLSPLSYVNATTLEYSSLLSQYQTQQQQLNQLQSQNQNLQQQINQQNQQISQLQTQNQQLEQNLQMAQGSISQRDSNNSNLNSQLNTANGMNLKLTYLAAVLGIIAVLAAVLGHHSGQPKKTQSVNPYAANYVPSQRERMQEAV